MSKNKHRKPRKVSGGVVEGTLATNLSWAILYASCDSLLCLCTNSANSSPAHLRLISPGDGAIFAIPPGDACMSEARKKV